MVRCGPLQLNNTRIRIRYNTSENASLMQNKTISRIKDKAWVGSKALMYLILTIGTPLKTTLGLEASLGDKA